MKTWHKVAIGAGAVVVLGGIVLFSVNQANKGVVTVQTAKVATQDSLVSLVTASGEVKPTTYTNVTAQGFGRITEILVREGDHRVAGAADEGAYLAVAVEEDFVRQSRGRHACCAVPQSSDAHLLAEPVSRFRWRGLGDFLSP